MPQSKITKSEKIFAGKVIELYQDSIIEPGGRAVVREVVRHPPAVVILPVITQNDLILIRQYRYPVDDVLWELPAGSLEPGESVLEAAVRELEEETGYHAESVSELASFFSAPGFTDERMHLVLATNLTKTAANPDDDESIESHAISRDKVYAMLFGGDIIDAKTIVGLLIARSKLGL
jgi:ADP-ribose pyrophosphatase